jgi:DNA polymerase
VSTNGLGPSERHTWVLDQRINQRGIKIDKEFVHASIDVLDQVRVPMTERFKELTGLKPTQREKVLNWVNDQGVPLGDMKKETLNAILDPDDEFGIEDFSEPLPYHIHEVLTLRRSLASSSVSKLRRMLECASDYDGRVRYSTQYHGARTGRDAGRLIQIQNYPRGEIGTRQGLTADILADAILTRDLDTIRELWGPDIFTAVISSLRSCIVPEKGKMLVAGDFAQVEAKNLLSMAGQHDKAEMLHSGQDAYAEMASLIYRKPINKTDNPLERQVGKNCVMGNGYGLGPVGFRARFCPKDSIELAQARGDDVPQGIRSDGPEILVRSLEASVDAVWCDHAKTYTYHRDRISQGRRLPHDAAPERAQALLSSAAQRHVIRLRR